jgi:hypothetical protein
MPSLRETLNKSPWIGWALAFVLLGVSAYLYFSRTTDVNAYNPERMREFVTVKFADTGEEERMPRGKFERALREAQKGQLDGSKGLVNPKTGQPTGFLFDKADWEETISRINDERKRLQGDAAKAASSTPLPVKGAAPSPKMPGVEKKVDESKK